MKSLMRVENITDEHLEELWPVIGGAPHLFYYGKDELRTGLVDGSMGGINPANGLLHNGLHVE